MKVCHNVDFADLCGRCACKDIPCAVLLTICRMHSPSKSCWLLTHLLGPLPPSRRGPCQEPGSAQTAWSWSRSRATTHATTRPQPLLGRPQGPKQGRGGLGGSQAAFSREGLQESRDEELSSDLFSNKSHIKWTNEAGKDAALSTITDVSNQLQVPASKYWPAEMS